jgi:uncharacterized protein DUF3667
MVDNNTCKNCSAVLKEGQKYCAFCGQKVEGRVTLASLFKNTISNYLSFDSKLLLTMPVFVFQPGKIARQFCDGKRISYLHPGQLYLFYSVLFFFVFSLQSNKWESLNLEDAKINLTLNKDSLEESRVDNIILSPNDPSSRQFLDSLAKEEEGLSSGISFVRNVDSLIALGSTNDEIIAHYFGESGFLRHFISDQVLNMYRANGNGVISTILSEIPLAIFLSLPFYTLLLWLTHIRHQKRFSEHLILTLYLFGFLFLLLTLLVLAVWMTGINSIWFLYFIIPPIYFLISFKVFYEQSWVKSFFKLLVVSIGFSPIIILTFLTTIALTVVFYGQ